MKKAYVVFGFATLLVVMGGVGALLKVDGAPGCIIAGAIFGFFGVCILGGE